MEVSFPTDADGFLSQECPSCEQRFKVLFGQGSEEPIGYCPYCGHHGSRCWYTKEQVAHIKRIAVRTSLGPELDKLSRSFGSSSRGFIKLDLNANLPEVGEPPVDWDEEFPIYRFACCDETIKAHRHDHLFCVICGTEINMDASESKKVFLSHKGIDKDVVREYKKTLELLGYAPWLDEDAMPAGTSLERGLLKGMEDSCGVVFFLTPSFKDEGFLETEVDYAIQQKRAKGDRFAIIALQFVGSDDTVGSIPSLLRSYVWKKPKTELEAIREIVRALPVFPGPVDWRSEITGVVTTPKIKSTLSTLSEEAMAILKAAAAGDGRIMHLKFLGGEETIQAGGTAMIPDDEPRTAAIWTGGLEDLRRRRYIRDLGHKGEVFEVTREGYQALV